MIKELYCAPKEYTYAGTLYVLDPNEEGATIEYWQPAEFGGTAVPHDDPINIFGADLNQHPNPPSHTAIIPFPSFTTTNPTALGIASRDDTRGTDQIKMVTYPCTDTAFTLTDTNGNTGERSIVLLNGAITEDNTDSVGGSANAYPPISAPAGVSELKIGTSDLSAWQGIAPSGGAGVTWFVNEPSWTAVPAFKCNTLLEEGFVDCNGAPLIQGDKDYWGMPPLINPKCCASGGADVELPLTLRLSDD